MKPLLILLAMIETVAICAQGPTPQRVVVNCTESTCAHAYSRGFLFVMAPSPEADVVAGGLIDSGHHIYVAVVVKNVSDRNIDVLPDSFSLTSTTGSKTRELSYVPPFEAVRNEVPTFGVANFFDGLAAMTASQRSVVQSSSTTTLNATSSDGTRYTGTAETSGSATITTPDTVARQEARSRIDQRQDLAEARREQLDSVALKATTLRPNDSVQGIVFFERDKKATQFTFTARIGPTDYVFNLTLR